MEVAVGTECSERVCDIVDGGSSRGGGRGGVVCLVTGGQQAWT